MAERYGNAIKRHLDNKMVRLSNGLYKNYTIDYESTNKKCAEKSEIIVQRIGGSTVDTVSVNQKLGYKFRPVIGKEGKYYIEYKKYGIILTLNSDPITKARMASFHYEIDNGRCSVKSGDVEVSGFNEEKLLFDYCGIKFRIILRDINDKTALHAASVIIDAIVNSDD